MDLKQLRYFAKVCEFGSISAAAAYLKKAQPSVSRHLSQLETELGNTLFLRHGRGIALTEAGQCLLERALVMLEEENKLHRQLASLSKLPEGEVTIGVPAMIGALFIPTLLQRLAASYPGIRLRVIEDRSDEIRKALITGSVDVALFYSNRQVGNLIYETLAEEDLYLIGRPEGLAGDSIAFSELHRFPLVLPSRGHELRELTEGAAQRLGVTVKVEVELGALSIIKKMLLTKGFYTLLPEVAAFPESLTGELKAVRLVEPSIPRSMVLATQPTGLSNAARAVASLSRREFRQVVEMRGAA